MLVVTRKVGERIMIGDHVVVTVVRIAGGLVRVGIEAPPSCPVVRKELVDSPSSPSHPPSSKPAAPLGSSPPNATQKHYPTE